MITELKQSKAVEQEIKKFLENIDNIASCVDLFDSIVTDIVNNKSEN